MQATLDHFYSSLKALSAPDIAACVTDDFVLNWQGTESIPWSGQWRGVGGLLSFVNALNVEVEILDVQRLHQVESGDTTIVILLGHWRIKSTGQEVRAMAANLFAFAGGRIQSYTVLNNSAAFAEALRPQGESK